MARARGMSRTSDEVTSLVAAVQEHIKFKQRAVYSIDTFYGQGHMQKSLLSKKLKPGAKQGRTRERNSQLQRLLSRPISTRFG